MTTAGNLLENAGFLDGTTGWGAVGGALSVDETTLGAPGRAVLTGGGAFSSPVPVGGLIEAYVWIIGGSARLSWLSGQNEVASTDIPVSRPHASPGRRGIPTTFDFCYVQAAPQGGGTQARIIATGSSAVLKPYVGAPSPWSGPRVWDPGSHANPDLQLPVWPPTLRPSQNTANPTPITNAKEFKGDSGIPIREDLYSGLHYNFKGEVRVSPDDLDDLESFYAVQRDQFYFVDPFSDRLCVAEWLADGAPAFSSDQGPTAIYTFGLHLTVA